MDRRQFLGNAAAAGALAAIPADRLLALTEISSDIRAVTGDGKDVVLLRAELTELADSLRGALLLPGDDGYDTARRVLNESIDRYPALVVQPNGVADIQHAVQFARDHELLLAVKCGGHSYGGKSTCERGMQIDLSSLRHVRVDPKARIAHVAGGSLLAGLDRESMAQGLVTTAGTVSHTGVGGLTLGGGFGRVARRFGLALDNLAGVDIVTADGRFLHASDDENPDLFWGVRGGGGNFGIVTSFQFRLHPMQRRVIGGNLVFPLGRARDVLNFYAEVSQTAPDDLYVDCALMAPASGDASAMLNVCYSGSPGRADVVLAPFDRLGKPLANDVGPVDYVALQQSFDDSDPRNEGEYLKSGFVNELPPELVDNVVAGFEPDPGRTLMVFFQHSGGAIGRVPVDATAFAHRRSLANMIPMLAWSLDTDGAPHIEYLRSYWNTLEQFTDGWYTNEASDETQRVLNANYQGNYPRLLALKNKYDPGNLFRLNANIRPTV